MKKKKRWIIGLSIVIVAAAVVIGVFLYARSFLSAETAIRERSEERRVGKECR